MAQTWSQHPFSCDGAVFHVMCTNRLTASFGLLVYMLCTSRSEQVCLASSDFLHTHLALAGTRLTVIIVMLCAVQ